MDSAMILSRGQRLRRDTIEFAKLSRDLGRKKDATPLPEIEPEQGE